MSEELLLQVNDLNKSFQGVKAVQKVSFDLHKGEILGFIGPNGSGKTTLINCITNFVKKDSGTVIFKGGNITKLPPHKIADKGLVRTFQIMRPYYNLPAFKNLIIPLYSPRVKRRNLGKLGDRDKVAVDLLEDTGFERDSRIPYQLASALPTGYLKRIELARCLALMPEVLITDEVFSGLSVSEVTSMVPLIESLQMRGVTLIMVEHRIRELFTLANRVIVMNFGEKIAEGKPDEVLQREEVRKAYLGSEEVST